jgi:hypothetical protein
MSGNVHFPPIADIGGLGPLRPIADIRPREQNAFMTDHDETRWEERLRAPAKRRDMPAADQPGPPTQEGDETPNPLPDKGSDGDDCGDPGRV